MDGEHAQLGVNTAIEAHWRAASALIVDARDVIVERPSARAPQWAVARGWDAWLANLPDDLLERLEVDGLAAHAPAINAPESLRELAARVIQVSDLTQISSSPGTASKHRVGARKRTQVAAFAAGIAQRFPHISRVVDLGAGHGHLTRHLADALDVEAVGLERDPTLVGTARALAAGRAQFITVDLFADTPELGPGDLVVGLHACGALSDRLLTLGIAAGACVAFASCCLHKCDVAGRVPLMPASDAGLTIPRAALGLANIATGAHGVETTLRKNVAARARRAGLRWLLRQRDPEAGATLREGDEMNGLNRRRAHRPFADLVASALGVRGLPAATASELAAAEHAGQTENDRVRRWAVARRMFGRPLEVQINLDRAMALETAGYSVEIGALWPVEVSPRNIGVFAHRA